MVLKNAATCSQYQECKVLGSGRLYFQWVFVIVAANATSCGLLIGTSSGDLTLAIHSVELWIKESLYWLLHDCVHRRVEWKALVNGINPDEAKFTWCRAISCLPRVPWILPRIEFSRSCVKRKELRSPTVVSPKVKVASSFARWASLASQKGFEDGLDHYGFLC